MSAVGYVFISTDAGKECHVLDKLRKIRGISEIYLMSGEYFGTDIIAKINARTSEDIKSLTLRRIMNIPSIRIAKTFIGPRIS